MDCLSRISCAGLGLAILSGFFFSVAGFTVKLVHLNPVLIVVIRSLIQLLFFLPFVLLTGSPVFGVPGERLPLFLRGLTGYLAFVLTYVSLRMIPLADSSTIVFSAPVFVLVIAFFVLKEECGMFQVFVLFLTITGVVLISRPTAIFGEDEDSNGLDTSVKGTLVALAASLFLSLNFVYVRMMKWTATAVITNAFSMGSIVCGILTLIMMRLMFGSQSDLLSDVYLPTSSYEISILLGNGLCGVAGLVTVTLALKIEEAGLVSLARTTDIIMAFILQTVYLPHEPVLWTSVVGAILICSAVSLSGVRRWLTKQPGKWEPFWTVLNCGHKDRESYVEI